MQSKTIAEQLEHLAAGPDFINRTYELTDKWVADGTGLEAVDTILRFMEKYPSIDYGAPGPLVHFVERFYRRGYEDLLVQSVKRCPTPDTIGMLHRLINSSAAPETRQLYWEVLLQARQHPVATDEVLDRVNYYLNRLQR